MYIFPLNPFCNLNETKSLQHFTKEQMSPVKIMPNLLSKRVIWFKKACVNWLLSGLSLLMQVWKRRRWWHLRPDSVKYNLQETAKDISL